MKSKKATASFFLAAFLVLFASHAPAQMRNPYGASINLETAKKVATAAVAEVRKNSWTMAVAVVDTNGDLVYFEKIVGAIGVSGGSSAQDGVAAKAGADSLAAPTTKAAK